MWIVYEDFGVDDISTGYYIVDVDGDIVRGPFQTKGDAQQTLNEIHDIDYRYT